MLVISKEIIYEKKHKTLNVYDKKGTFPVLVWIVGEIYDLISRSSLRLQFMIVVKIFEVDIARIIGAHCTLVHPV